MAFEFFAIPMLGAVDARHQPNSFLAQHRVLYVERRLVKQGDSRATWPAFSPP